MAISYYTEDVRFPAIKRRKINHWIKQVAASYNKKVGDISYVFCSDEKILEINRTYLQHDYYTDIITFDYSESNKIAGDLFISIETVATNAEKYQTVFDEELHRTVIHGILHLCGIEDKMPGQREKMEQEENKALALYRNELKQEKDGKKDEIQL